MGDNDSMLIQIQARVEKATPGPWSVMPWHDGTVMPTAWLHFDDGTGPLPEQGGTIIAQESADAEFIAHARSDIPNLLRIIERLHKIAREIDMPGSDGFALLDEADDLVNGVA